MGISAFYHDSAATLIKDGEIISAVQEERFSRKKHDARYPFNAIKYILDENRSSVRVPQVEKPAIIDSEVTINAAPTKETNHDIYKPVAEIDASEIKTLKELEYEAISAGLERNNWNMTTTSQELGISRLTL